MDLVYKFLVEFLDVFPNESVESFYKVVGEKYLKEILEHFPKKTIGRFKEGLIEESLGKFLKKYMEKSLKQSMQAYLGSGSAVSINPRRPKNDRDIGYNQIILFDVLNIE